MKLYSRSVVQKRLLNHLHLHQNLKLPSPAEFSSTLFVEGLFLGYLNMSIYIALESPEWGSVLLLLFLMYVLLKCIIME